MSDLNKIKTGGLFRCCIQTLQDTPVSQEIEDIVIPCLVCNESCIFEAGMWRWNYDRFAHYLAKYKLVDNIPDVYIRNFIASEAQLGNAHVLGLISRYKEE